MGGTSRARSGKPAPTPTPNKPGLLYDAVAVGMRAYACVRFDVTTFGAERLCLDPGTMIVSTHRSDDDVPLLCGTLYAAARLWRQRDTRVAFAVRDDLFEPGFFAGYPRGLPLAVRRATWPIAIGNALRLRLGCLPIRSATSMRIVQLLRAAPWVPTECLPLDVVSRVERRASELGEPLPRVGGELVRPEYAEFLWGIVHRSEVDHPGLDEVWRSRAGAALKDLRSLVATLQAGWRLLFFPEGRPSPDGAIGPLQPGISTLVRRGGVSTIQPIALAYDPVGVRRTRAFVSVGEPFVPNRDGLDDQLLGALRRATPLTAGQLAARAAADGNAGHAAVLSEIENARRAGHPVAPELLANRHANDFGWLVATARTASHTAARLRQEFESARFSPSGSH